MIQELILHPENLVSYAPDYATAAPYPHIMLDNFLTEQRALEALESFPKVGDEGWIHYLHYNEKKHGLNKKQQLPKAFQTLIDELNSEEFIKLLGELTGINGLTPDDTLEGGGLHQSEKGGFLNIHADFTVHPHQSHWRRRVNLLIYFNPDWKEEYGGALELWDRDMKHCRQKILPMFNRCVIFNTDFDSFHGFPDPITCPPNESRKSLALYYYTIEKEKPRKVATNYMGRPGDGFRKGLIWADKKAVAAYNAIKGSLNLNDDFASSFLRKLNRKK